MRPEDLYVPDDFDALRMENELLAFENQYLRAQVTEERELRAAAGTARKVDTEDSGGTIPPGSRVVEREIYERLTKARSDLVWLLKRVESTPARLVLRRWEGWRVLTRRYLGESDADA